MKKLLTLALALIALATFSHPGVAQQEGRQKHPPTGVETKQPGKVLEVNNKAKTFTVMVKGKTVTVNAANLKSLPKAGDTINMGRGGADPTGQRVVCAVVECDMGWGSGPCLKCFDYQPL
jgi:hypothetical protein